MLQSGKGVFPREIIATWEFLPLEPQAILRFSQPIQWLREKSNTVLLWWPRTWKRTWVQTLDTKAKARNWILKLRFTQRADNLRINSEQTISNVLGCLWWMCTHPFLQNKEQVCSHNIESKGLEAEVGESSWRDSYIVMSTGCSCRGLATKQLLTPVPRGLMPSSGHQEHRMHVMHIYIQAKHSDT